MFIDAIHGAALMGLHDSAYRPRPSMAGPERCLRQIVYKGRGVEGAPVGSRLAMVLKDGDAHERVSIDVLRHTLLHIHSEQHPIDLVNALPWRAHLPGYTCSVCTPTGDTPHIIPASTLHGHLDYLGRDLFGDNHLGEHKGVVSHIFKRFWEWEKEPLDYFTQNVCYFRGLREEGLVVNTGGLLIKNKDTSAYLEFEFEYDYDQDRLFVGNMIYAPGLERRAVNKTYTGLYHQAIEKFRLADQHIADQTLPPRLDDADDTRCLYCPYQDLCWEGYEQPPLTQALMLPDHLLPLAKELFDLEAELKQLKPKSDRQEELKTTLIKELTVLQATTLTSPDLEIQLTQSSQNRLDEKRLPTSIKKAFIKTITVNRLTVRRPKPQAKSKRARPRPTSTLTTIPSGTHQAAA